MFFIGNRHQSFPTAVVQDPVLEPVDKLVWMVILLPVHETGGNTAFPGYEAIGRNTQRVLQVNDLQGHRHTACDPLADTVRPAARSQWSISWCVYALHDEPLPLVDALHLDADYMTFLDHSLSHGHARVRTVAQGVLDSMDEDIQEAKLSALKPHPIERRSFLSFTASDQQCA